MKCKQALAIISCILLSIPGLVTAQDPTGLFIEMDGLNVMPTSVIEENRGILSKSQVNVNVQALRNGSNVQDNANSKTMVAQPDAGEGFLMQLPDGTVVTLVTNRLQSFVKGVETYTGRVKDIESGFFTLSIEDDKVFGQVNIEYMAYDIRFDNAFRSHVLTEVDLARMPHQTPEPLGDGTAYKAALRSLISPSSLSSPINGNVRVLILHASDVSNPNTLASNIISEMNESIFENEINPDIFVTLADLRNLNDDLDELCSDDILEDMETPTAPFTNIATWIDDEYADVVLTIATTDSSLTCTYTGSWGRVGGQASDLLNPTMPYAVTADTYAIGDLTAIHELGHVFGGGHPTWPVSTLESYSDDVEPYSRGYIAADGDWQTIMGAYDGNGCDFSTTLPNTDCVRIPFWSNPNTTYAGEARGVTYTDDNQVPYSANMRSALEIQIPLVAAFESYPDSAPAVPGNFRVIRLFCYGRNTAAWNSVSTAENYQVFRSYYSNFSYPQLIYFGPNTLLPITVSQGQPWYLKVRACNGSGCGDLSAQKTATYYDNCL